MAIGVSKSHTRVLTNRKWEDYQSLKKFFSKHKALGIKEWLWNGGVTMTGGAVELQNGTGETIAYLSANDIVYLATEADDATQDGLKVWIDYINSSGELYEAVETILDSRTSTATEVPIGCMSGELVDPVASVAGDILTMTATPPVRLNYYKDWYVLGSGDATHQEGASLQVLSSSLDDPVKLTCTTTPNANWADDNVSIQKTLNDDVFRIRRMWSEEETIAASAITVCDKDATNIYAIIGDTNTQGGASSRYTALSTDYRCFLGRIVMDSASRVAADGEALGHEVTITYTPKVYDSNQDPADITYARSFQDHLDWQPCIELEPGTDVIIKAHSILNDAAFYELGAEISYLEVKIA